MIRGIDVSRYQGAIAWLTVAPQIDFAYIKAGGGDDLSPYFDSFAHGNAIGARQAGIPFGFYWFFSGRNSVASQLALIRNMRSASQGDALPWAIDIEDQTRGAGDIIGGLALAAEVEQLTGARPLIYTGAWWWDPKWALARTMGAPEVVPYALWVASYTNAPIIPRGWADYTVWQHTDKGRVPGIIGNVDSDQARAQFWDAPAQEVTMTRGQPRIDYGRVVHVLPSDASAAAMKTVMDAGYGRRETVGFSYDDAGVGDLSSRRAVLWDIPAAKQAEFVAFYGQYYPGVVVEFRQTAPVVVIPPVDPPPPAVTGKTRLGVNVITGDGGAVNRAISAGCNAVSIINNFLLASQTAMNPAITVMARRYVSSMPSPDLGLYEGAESPNVIYLTALNECDVICYGSVDEIARRAAWDREMWRKMKAKGRKYAGGGFSVGTPDYTKPEICEAMRTHYAPLYADGMAINYHLYSPWPNHAMDHWYELRWRFLFERCGFDPNPALAGIYCDETGMDQGSVGGFPAVGFSAQQVGAWCRQFLDASQGGGYGNMLRAAAIFQAGNGTDWNGYRVDYAFPEIGAAAQSPVARTLNRPRMIDTARQPDIQPEPRKVIAQYEVGQ